MLFYVLLPDKKMQMKTETYVISPGRKGQIVSFLIWIMDPPTGICLVQWRPWGGGAMASPGKLLATPLAPQCSHQFPWLTKVLAR